MQFLLTTAAFQTSSKVPGQILKSREFSVRGFFDQEIGDFVIRLCSNILQVPIMVITSSETIPFLPFNCDNPLSNTPIYIAYHYFGAGHYDATESITNGKLK